MDHKDLKKLFFPESVVICGVSDGKSNLGRRIVMNLNRFAFSGRAYGLGRKAMELERIRVYTDLKEIPEIPELAVILVPAGAVAGLLEACGRLGIRAAIIETAGFSEFAADGKGLEEEIKRAAAEYGITCMGPNCIGIVNLENGLCLPFVPFSSRRVHQGRQLFCFPERRARP